MGKGGKEVDLHLVAWEDICKSKWNGGLGIERLRDVNKALFQNGFGVLGMTMKVCGDKSLLANMVY